MTHPELFEVLVKDTHMRSPDDWYWRYQLALIDQSKKVCVDVMNSYPHIGSPGTSITELIKAMEEQGHLLLLPGVVYGFALRNRRWGKFSLSVCARTTSQSENIVNLDVTLVQPIQFEAEWNDLVLPPGHKDMVRAVVENHATGSRSTKGMTKSPHEVDIVRGKGVYEMRNSYCYGRC